MPREIPKGLWLTSQIGPLRHPRPLTPAELHLELEKEQEAVINRLTRELSLLRQQTASVVSNTSSTSVSDSMVPTSARRHRSSSSVSARSISAVTTGATSVSGVAPARESSMPGSARPSVDIQRPTLSRESSRGPSHHPVAASPAVQYARQPSGSSTVPPSSESSYHPRSPSFSTAFAAARYEEAAYHRTELENVKRENEALRQRIRELERAMNHRASPDDTEARGRPDSSAIHS